jgi:hypothetical protein
MTKTILISAIVLCFVVEALVIAGIYSTRRQLLSGWDAFDNRVDRLSIDIGGKLRVLDRGAYVVTHSGPVPLPWYWVYRDAYLTVSLPIVLALGLAFSYSRSARHSEPHGA